MLPSVLPSLFTPAATGLSMNLIAVLIICGVVLLGVVYIALSKQSGSSD